MIRKRQRQKHTDVVTEPNVQAEKGSIEVNKADRTSDGFHRD